MSKTMKAENLFFGNKRQEALEKKLIANLLQLIKVMQGEVMIPTMKLVKCKYLLVNLKTKK